MQIILVRHGAAEDFEVGSSRPDSDRQMTKKGRKEMTKVAKGLRRTVDTVDVIASSPYVRAVQTAEIVSKELSKKRPIEIQQVDALSSGTGPETMTEWLATQDPEATIVLIGHEPDFSTLMAYLTTNDSGSYAKLSKAGVCLIDCPTTPAMAKGKLLWLVTPAMLSDL